MLLKQWVLTQPDVEDSPAASQLVADMPLELDLDAKVSRSSIRTGVTDGSLREDVGDEGTSVRKTGVLYKRSQDGVSWRMR